MKHIKRLSALLLAVCMAASLSVSACVADKGTPAESSIISPRAVEVNEPVFSKNGDYQTIDFACASSNGSTLRVFYRNESDHECTVTLYEYGFFGVKLDVGNETIPAGGEKYFSYSNPGGKTFCIRVKSTDGGEVEGYLRANQF